MTFRRADASPSPRRGPARGEVVIVPVKPARLENARQRVMPADDGPDPAANRDDGIAVIFGLQKSHFDNFVIVIWPFSVFSMPTTVLLVPVPVETGVMPETVERKLPPPPPPPAVTVLL